MKCRRCKYETEQNIRFCPKCGKRIIDKEYIMNIFKIILIIIFFFFLIYLILIDDNKYNSFTTTNDVNAENDNVEEQILSKVSSKVLNNRKYTYEEKESTLSKDGDKYIINIYLNSPTCSDYKMCLAYDSIKIINAIKGEDIDKYISMYNVFIYEDNKLKYNISYANDNTEKIDKVEVLSTDNRVFITFSQAEEYFNNEEKKREEYLKKMEAEAEQRKKEALEQEKNSYENISYKDLARNPNSYVGKKVKFRGEVIQVLNIKSNNIILRVNVTQDEYGYWDDTIYVTYEYSNENESKILEEDIITFYGEFKGIKDYDSILTTISIPEVSAKYIDIE